MFATCWVKAILTGFIESSSSTAKMAEVVPQGSRIDAMNELENDKGYCNSKLHCNCYIKECSIFYVAMKNALFIARSQVLILCHAYTWKLAAAEEF